MSIAELQKLPALEKLKIIEALWSDISSDEGFTSPSWHAEQLKATESAHTAGRVEEIDWQDAKKELRRRFE